MNTLQLLKDYAKTSDNYWLAKKLQDLEVEIINEVHNEKMKVYDDLIGMI